MSESTTQAVEKQRLPNPMTTFINGAKKGTNLVLQVVIPNVIFAMVFMKLLTLSGLIDLIGLIFSPIMAIFGLPGQAAMPMVLSFTSIFGGLTSTAALAAEGVLNGDQVLMMLTYTLLVGSTFAMYTGRILGVTGVAAKDYKISYITVVVTGLLSLLVMRILLSII